MLAITFSFLVLLSSVTAIITSSSRPQVGQDHQQNTSRLFPLSGGNSSEYITNSVTISVSSPFVSLAGPTPSGSENGTGAMPTTPTTFRVFHHTFVTFVSPSPSSVSSTSFIHHTSSSLIPPSSGSAGMPFTTAKYVHSCSIDR